LYASSSTSSKIECFLVDFVVGALDGSGVGLNSTYVGSNVGKSVGMSDGTEEGIGVGLFSRYVGAKVGVTVGALVGFTVGAGVGYPTR